MENGTFWPLEHPCKKASEKGSGDWTQPLEAGPAEGRGGNCAMNPRGKRCLSKFISGLKKKIDVVRLVTCG